MGLNPAVFITVLIAGSLLMGIVTAGTVGEDALFNNLMGATTQYKDDYSTVEGASSDSSSITSDQDFSQTAGHEFKMGLFTWNVLKYSFGGFAIILTAETAMERLLILPTTILNAILGVYVMILLVLYTWGRKTDF